MDEIDRALAEIASKGKGKGKGMGADLSSPLALASATSKAALDPTWTKVKDIFSFDPKFLDADAELRRMFGSKVVRALCLFVLLSSLNQLFIEKRRSILDQ